MAGKWDGEHPRIILIRIGLESGFKGGAGGRKRDNNLNNMLFYSLIFSCFFVILQFLLTFAGIIRPLVLVQK